MTKSSTPVSSGSAPNTQASSPSAAASRVMVRVEKFPTAQPKFAKDTWDSGEG